MPTDIRRSRKKRGHVSSGHGRVGKHRKHPGGRGNSGGQHHHKIFFEKYHKKHFGKTGMRYYRKLKQNNFNKSINLDKISDKLVKNMHLHTKNSSDSFDLSLIGMSKVLGRGRMVQKPFVIKANSFSKVAVKKIKKAGGYCILTP
ncbi:60S ribosomal protein L27A [Guillardia theta]|uniref:60S ribosomal protein L27A n=1 Tax=Guillardia theta TaxID=55529 RepID=Q9AW02_GUITH|nr:60S ribosomal protein L27A [Guillardia theta]CAC27069.1 60S ribosomal protein L27A [Guillardia theta]